MTAKPKKKKLTGSVNLSAQAFSGSNGSTIQGFQKNIPSHPYSGGTAVNMGGIASAAFEGFENKVNQSDGALTPVTGLG